MSYIFLILLSCLSQNLFSSQNERSNNPTQDKNTQTLSNLTLQNQTAIPNQQPAPTIPQEKSIHKTQLQQAATKDSMIGHSRVYGDGL